MGANMDTVWKVLIAPILVAAVGGIIVGLVLAKIQAPEEATLTAQLQWLDVPNPVYGEDTTLQDRRIKALEQAYPNSSFIKLLNENRFKSIIRLLQVKFSNNSDLRSKEIEITGSQDALFVSPQSKSDSQPVSSLVLKPLGPRESAVVWGVSQEWFDFEEHPLRVVHDNRLMNVSLDTMTSDPTGAARFANEHPLVAFFFVTMGAGLAFLFAIAFVVGLLSNLSVEFKSKITTASEAKKMQEFLEYLRLHHPEKLSQAPGPPAAR